MLSAGKSVQAGRITLASDWLRKRRQTKSDRHAWKSETNLFAIQFENRSSIKEPMRASKRSYLP